MEKELILEIGTEEIPAGFLEQATKDLGVIAQRELGDNLLPYKDIQTFGTPRRLVLMVTGLSDKQGDRIIETLGPPKRIAYDESGAPTKAALGFAKAQGVDVRDLVILQHEKGELVTVRRKTKGEKTERVLKNLLPKIILSIPFRKSMRWGNGNTAFARPVRWILSLYGGKTISFKLENVKSGSKTYGHRFMSPRPIRVKTWDEYKNGLEKGFVILDPEKRRQIIKSRISEIAKEIGGIPLEDKELLQTVVQLVEYPVVLKGNFDNEFLQLPQEVLISVMKNHQKYFPVFSISNDQKLFPHFIFVCGTRIENPQIVIVGNERVIKARFTDARFFFEEDKKAPLVEKVEKLKSMVFLSDLGTYYDKTKRMEDLVTLIGVRLGFQDSVKELIRAAELSKADLATQMVFELPELQGTMGKYYALISGEKEEVARAIGEQYMPTSRDGKLPETGFGAILSIADKTDTISACFISGLTPSGTSDPYALRRQAIGIINIMLNKKFHLSLREIFNASLNRIWNQPHIKIIANQDTLLTEIMDFIVERFRNIMISYGFSQDVIDAVISAEGNDIGNDIVKTMNKIEALSEFRESPDFNSLAITFKRVVNIVKGQPRVEINQPLFVEPAERQLYQVYSNAKETVSQRLAHEKNVSERNYRETLDLMKNLKGPVDEYFDKVLVMDKNEEVRLNRLSTLWEIRDLFFMVADFSKIST